MLHMLKNKKGSTIIAVLLVLSVLSILGMTLLSLSMSNFKMKMIDSNIKTTFYFSEAGLEEAYAEIGKIIHEAIQSGNEEVKNNISVFIQEERMKEIDEPGDTILEDSEYIDGTDGSGPVNENKIKEKMNQYFQYEFRRYMNEGSLSDSETHPSLEKRLKDKYIKDGYGKLDTTIIDENASVHVEWVDKFNIYSDSTYIISLVSQFNYQGVTKKLKATHKIMTPQYGAPYYVMNEKKAIHQNVLFNKALTTEEDILVEGGNVIINGDIYAYGTQPEDKTLSGDFGGVAVGGKKSGELEVNGNIYTNSYVHTNGNNSSITVNNGDIFCNSLVVQQNKVGCDITINDGVVNTLDDLELNGKHSNITINGSYYGFSEGLTGHNESSSIVINSPDIKSNHSSLIITGEEVDDHQPDLPLVGNNNYVNGTYLGGTVYIHLLGNTAYQTGESVSVKGNYKGYTYYFALEDIQSTPGYSPSDDQYEESNIIMGDYSPLVLADKFSDGTSMNASHRSRYIELYDDLNKISETKYDYPLNLGGDMGIQIGNLIHSVGVWIHQNTLKGSKMAADADTLAIPIDKKREYLFHINRFGDSTITDLSSSILDTQAGIDHWFLFDHNFLKTSTDLQNEIVFVNDDPDKVLVIQGKGASETGDYKINDSDFKGIIMTKGEVIITGEVSFQGMIAAEKDIVFKGRGTKTLSNTPVIQKTFIYPKVVENSRLMNQFQNNGASINFLYQSQAGVDDTGSFLKFEDIIETTWEKVK